MRYFLNHQTFNIFLLFVLSLLWGLHFSLVKVVDVEENPITILIPLLFILCILFYLVLMITNNIFIFTYKKTIFFIIAGALAYIIPLYIEFLVAPKIDAGVLTLIVSSVPVFTLLFVWLFRLLSINLRLIIGTLSGLIGISIIILGNSINSLNLWLIMSLIVPISYAFDAIFMEKFWPSNFNYLQVAYGECLVSFILLLLLNILISDSWTVNINEFSKWFSIQSFWLLTMVTFFEVLLFFYILSRAGAVFINIGSYLVIPAGFFWGFIIFNETFSLLKIISTTLVVFAVILIGNQNYKIKNTPIE